MLYTVFMKPIDRLIEKLPKILTSKLSIYIYLFLFFYLVIVAITGIFIPSIEPSYEIQTIFGNYTSIISAMGASLAAGFGYHHAKHNKTMKKKHDNLERSVKELHEKLDKLSK